MPPLLFVALILSGALILLLALTVGPKSSFGLGLMLIVGTALLLIPLIWMLIGQTGLISP